MLCLLKQETDVLYRSHEHILENFMKCSSNICSNNDDIFGSDDNNKHEVTYTIESREKYALISMRKCVVVHSNIEDAV